MDKIISLDAFKKRQVSSSKVEDANDNGAGQETISGYGPNAEQMATSLATIIGQLKFQALVDHSTYKHAGQFLFENIYSLLAVAENLTKDILPVFCNWSVAVSEDQNGSVSVVINRNYMHLDLKDNPRSVNLFSVAIQLGRDYFEDGFETENTTLEVLRQREAELLKPTMLELTELGTTSSLDAAPLMRDIQRAKKQLESIIEQAKKMTLNGCGVRVTLPEDNGERIFTALTEYSPNSVIIITAGSAYFKEVTNAQ